MKKFYFTFFIASLLLVNSASAVVVNISQSGFSFSPNAVSVNVGDVIHFTWGSGVHTTTSTSVPSGAPTWDAPLDASNTSYDYEVVVAGNYLYHCSFHSNMLGGFTAAAGNTVEPVIASSGEVAQFIAGVDYNTRTLHIAMENFNPSHAVLRMLDITGKEVGVLLNTPIGMGEQRYRFDMSNNPSGIYFLRLEQSGKVVTRKILLN